MPTAAQLTPVVLRALEAHGGVATNQQIELFAVTDLGLTPEVASRPHEERRERGRTELGYRIHAVTRWEELVAFAWAFVRENYGDSA